MKLRRNISVFFAVLSVVMMFFATACLFIAKDIHQMAFATLCVPCWAIIGFIAVIDADKQDKMINNRF